MQFDNSNYDGLEQASTLEDGQFLLSLRKIMKREVEVLVIRTVEQMIVPIVGDLVRKVVKEEIQSVEKRLLAGKADEVTVSKERHLELKLSGDVSNPVLTGKPLKGKEDNPLKVELVDRATGRVVENEPISSAKVELLVLDASHDDNWTQENFNNRIIRKGDKKRPHFSKNIYIDLKDGVGFLSNVKLGHDSSWMKKGFKCRLGARIVDGFRGVHVQEGRTDSFMVEDCRSKLYEKHYPPYLSDEVWRLDNIGREGARCKRLNEENIKTVGDFLFLLSVDPQRLQQLVGAGAKWEATVDHAQTCVKDDKVYLHWPSTSTEYKMGVTFDAVGGLKGIIKDSHYLPIDELSAEEKDGTRELLLSAFKNREARTCYDDESCLLKQFPHRPLSVSEYLDGHYPVEADTEQIHSPILGFPIPSPAVSNPNDMLPLGSPVSPLDETYLEYLTWSSLINDGSNYSTEILMAEPLSHQYRLVAVAKAKVWVLRAKKRVKTLGGTHAHKKQKT